MSDLKNSKILVWHWNYLKPLKISKWYFFNVLEYQSLISRSQNFYLAKEFWIFHTVILKFIFYLGSKWSATITYRCTECIGNRICSFSSKISALRIFQCIRTLENNFPSLLRLWIFFDWLQQPRLGQWNIWKCWDRKNDSTWPKLDKLQFQYFWSSKNSNLLQKRQAANIISSRLKFRFLIENFKKNS